MRVPILFLAAAMLLGGQQDGPVFRAGTRLVEVTVTVLDKKGGAVAGLTPSNFTVVDRGKVRPIAFFRFEGLPESPAPKPRLEPGVFTNRVELAGGPPRGVTALVLDALNTLPQDGAAARAQTMRYLKAMAPESRLAIFLMGRELRILHDFTDDAASLRARLDKVEIDMPAQSVSDITRPVEEARQFLALINDPALRAQMTQFFGKSLAAEMEANSAARRGRREQSLVALESLGRHLGGIPGRKNLVWIGGGFSMESVSGPAERDRVGTRVRDAARRLAERGVTLYIVDARGVGPRAPLTAASRFPQSSGRISDYDPLAAMNLMASITGGRYLYGTNDLAAGFRQAVADLHGSYTLGFYATEEADNQWHELKVRVNLPELTLRHREGYLADHAPAEPFDWSEEAWQAAISNPLGSSIIPLTARCEPASNGELALALEIDPRNLQFRAEGAERKAELQVVVAERTAAGRARMFRGTLTATVPAAGWEKPGGRSIPFRRQWKPEADTKSLRVIVRERQTGQFGTLDVPLGRRIN